MVCPNKNSLEWKKLVSEVGETFAAKVFIASGNMLPEMSIINKYIDEIKSSNDLNSKILNLSEANKVLGTTYKKQISDAQLKNLKNKISIKNNQLNKQGESIVYKLYNVKQLGESDNYTWSIREIKGKLNVQDKIERAKARGQFQQAKDLEQGDQLKLFQLQPEQNVNYILKIVNALDKVNRNKFETSKLQGWLNDLQKQGAPTQQLDLFKEVAKDGMTKDEIAAAILANYSYTVEINTAKESIKSYGINTEFGNFEGESFTVNGINYSYDPYSVKEERYLAGNRYIDKEDYEAAKLKRDDNKIPTQIYSNLTVPGGTNYTENEIATSAITPSIKGHAQFATDKGIGWFRSDDKIVPGEDYDELIWEEEADQEPGIPFQRGKKTIQRVGEYQITKTRRILEVQSDLFQKGRDKEDLTTTEKTLTNLRSGRGYNTDEEIKISKKEYEEAKIKGKKDNLIGSEGYENERYLYNNFYYSSNEDIFDGKYFYKTPAVNTDDKANQFLQLLNKDNNWVTFFVKAILQDSVKKGYEKVLFPKGDTASKVEGHTTLEEFKKQKENRIKELENRKNKNINNINQYDIYVDNELVFENLSETEIGEYQYSNAKIITKNTNIDIEINQLKQELERVETEGFGALKPIYNFYENTITNILKKQGYNPVLITDEYGNTWNEVKIKPEQLNTILLQLKSEQTDSKEIIEQIDKNLNDYIKNNNINIEFKDQVLDSNGNDVVAFYDGVKKVIEINEGKRDSKTLPEELAHHLHLALGKDHILVKRAFNLLNRVDYKAMLGQEYVDLYKNNTDLLKFEILGKLTAAAVRGEKIPLQMNTVEGNKLWDTIKRMIDAVIKLFKPDANVQKELDNLSNQFADMLKSGVKVDSEKSINAKLYQTNKDLINLSSKIKPAYVYYTTLSTALKKKQKQFSALSEEYKIIQNQINTIDISLRELIQNENELPLINLVEETITTVAQNINDFEINYSKGIMPSEKNIIEAVEILKKFSGFPGTESKINALKARLINFIKPYLANKASEVLGKPVTEEDISAVTSDINVLEKNFGTLARTEFTLSRMLGLLIKQKQNTIERENKQAFEQVQAATDKLKDWAASKGMSLEQAFDVLQQEYRGTRILTKEYTSEFYKLINDTYKLDPEKAKEARAKIAIWDATNKKWIPKSTKYNNPNYQLIHKKGNEDLLNYYNFFKDQIQKISDNTLPIELDDYFIPNVYEETLLDILKTEDAVGDKLKDSVIHILEFNPFEKMGTVDKQMDVIYDADLIGDKIPLKYIQALPEDKKSKNLSAALLKFMYFANSYNHMNEILPIANLVQETITDPDTSKILQYGNPNLNVAAKSNIVDMVKTIKEMQILGKMRKENEMFNVLGYKLNYGKLIDFGLQYTSKIRLGLNPFAALANVAVGNLGNIIEAAGGKYFTLSEYFSALGTFTTEAKKVDGLINLFNPLMEMDDYENLKKLGVGSKEYREKINGLLYAPTRMGEKQMQTTTMIAILKHKKVDIKDKKGNVTGSISMLDAFDSNGKWDTAKMGYELNEQEINKITNRVHGVNQMIHGRYSAKDAAAMQQYAMYRALMQFKKWIPAAVEQRFMARRYDPLLDEETEGRYWAYTKGLRLMMAKLKNDTKKIEENKFTELDWYNMRRNAMEVLMIGLMFGLTTFLKAGDDDDELKRNASYKTYMRLLNSVSGDLMQWYLPGTFLDKAMVLPVTKTLRSLERTIQYTPYMFGDYTSDASGTYEAGERKDENKFWSNFFNNVPFGSTTADMYRTWFKDDVSYIPRNR